jgi:hypothetical protein
VQAVSFTFRISPLEFTQKTPSCKFSKVNFERFRFFSKSNVDVLAMIIVIKLTVRFKINDKSQYILIWNFIMSLLRQTQADF